MWQLLLIPAEQAVAALKKRIDTVTAELGCNVAVRAVEWHSRMHRVQGWEREISRVSLPSIPDLRQGIKDVLGDCFLLLSPRWHDVLLSEVLHRAHCQLHIPRISRLHFF
jgi:hypothetical protein